MGDVSQNLIWFVGLFTQLRNAKLFTPHFFLLSAPAGRVDINRFADRYHLMFRIFSCINASIEYTAAVKENV